MSKKYLLLFIGLFSLLTLFFPENTKAVTDHLIISQIQIAGTSATDEFVEIFNPTDSPIDLTGFRLSKKVSSGTQSNLIASMSGTINPNSYLLLGHTNCTGTADKTYSTSSVTADNVVILYSDSGLTIADKVGFGAPFESETLPFAANPASNQSIRRINNQDTDNNSVDFELLQISSPRNSSFVSPTENPTPTPIPSLLPLPTPSPTSTPAPSPSSTPSPSPLPTPEQPSPSPSTSPSPSASPTPTASSPTPRPEENHEIKLPFGLRCKFEMREFKFRKHHFKYFRVSFHRH